MKDPLDQEKPWSVWGQLVVITLPIAVVHFVIRLVVPEWGWQMVVPVAVLAPSLYYFLAFRSGLIREPRDPHARYTAAQRRLQLLLAVLLGAMALMPLGVGVYYFWNGALPW